MAKILLVDDEKALTDVLTVFLKHHGHQPATANEGWAAWELLETEPFDCVLLDIMLPGPDGLELLRRLRALPAPKGSTPVLLLTARVKVGDRVAGLQTGADDYLTKPFSTAELLARIEALLRRSGR